MLKPVLSHPGSQMVSLFLGRSQRREQQPELKPLLSSCGLPDAVLSNPFKKQEAAGFPGARKAAIEMGRLFQMGWEWRLCIHGTLPSRYSLPRLGMGGWKHPFLRRREAASLSGISPPLSAGRTMLFHSTVYTGIFTGEYWAMLISGQAGANHVSHLNITWNKNK